MDKDGPKQSPEGEHRTTFEETGLDPTEGWRNAAMMYMVGGALGLAIDVLLPSVNWVWQARAASLIALLSGPIFLWASKRFAPAGITAHMRMTFGLALMSWVLWHAGDTRAALWPIVIFTILAPAWLHSARVAASYAVASIGVVAVSLVTSGTSPGRIITTLSVLSLLAVGVNRQQQGLRRIANANRTLALIDALTGVANIRLFRRQLQKRLDSARTTDIGLWALALDMDKFKLVNDRHNHTVGDRMIQEVAQAILRTVRKGDLVARRGGDEFYVVCSSPGQPPLELIDRLERAIAVARLGICPELPSSVGIGYVAHRSNETVDSLMTRADEALHDAKLAPREGIKDSDPTGMPVVLDDAPREEAAISTRGTIARLFSGAPRWVWAASMYLFAAITSILVITASSVNLADNLATSVAIAGLVVLGIWCLVQSQSQTTSTRLRVTNAIGLALILGLVLSDASRAPDLVELMVLPVVYHSIFERHPGMWLAFGVAMAGFGAALLIDGYEYSMLGTVVMTVVLAATAGRLSHAGKIADSFVDQTVAAAELDPLTGIANVRGLRRLVEREVAAKSDKLLVLFSIDLDDFKQVNDLHSHQVGDRTLQATADAIKRAIAGHGVAARRGGDEFSAVCRVRSLATATEVAVEISDQIEDARSSICEDVLPTASVAFIQWQDGEASHEFLLRADSELHRSKAASHERRNDDRARWRTDRDALYSVL